MIPNYGKVWRLGTPEAATIHSVTDPIFVQEKLDGSQFSFRVNGDGSCDFRSKSTAIQEDLPPKLFAKAVAFVSKNRDAFTPNAVYRGEALYAKRHNVLTYDRAPEAGFILFDTPDSPPGVEVVPTSELASGLSLEVLQELTSRPSMLGGMREGVVLKAYGKPDPSFPGTYLKVKYVVDAFKEAHAASGKFPQDKVNRSLLGSEYATDARYRKAVQRLEESGQITYSTKDIGTLMQSLNVDLEEECVNELKERWWKENRKDCLRNASQGFASWYKDYLLQRTFEHE